MLNETIMSQTYHVDSLNASKNGFSCTQQPIPVVRVDIKA